MSKLSLNEVALRKSLYAFKDFKIDTENKIITINLFMKGESKFNIFVIIQFQQNAIKATKKSRKWSLGQQDELKGGEALKYPLNFKDGISQRALAELFEALPLNINYVIKNRANFQFRKKKQGPKRTSLQKTAFSPLSRKITIIFRKKAIFENYEFFFCLSKSILITI